MAAKTLTENTIKLFKLALDSYGFNWSAILHHPKLQKQEFWPLQIVKANLLSLYFVMKTILISITFLTLMSQTYMAVCEVKEVRSRS